MTAGDTTFQSLVNVPQAVCTSTLPAADMLLFLADVSGKILYANVMFESALHYPIGESSLTTPLLGLKRLAPLPCCAQNHEPAETVDLQGLWQISTMFLSCWPHHTLACTASGSRLQ